MELRGRWVGGSGSGSAHTIVFARAQKAQKVEETLNKFKRTHLVSRKMGRHTGWGGKW